MVFAYSYFTDDMTVCTLLTWLWNVLETLFQEYLRTRIVATTVFVGTFIEMHTKNWNPPSEYCPDDVLPITYANSYYGI